jgi:hypothetical protein|tara:strand:+ start:88 stop:324 length:237 start_codon:yes stop_codon:yes gene_type:complete
MVVTLALSTATLAASHPPQPTSGQLTPTIVKPENNMLLSAPEQQILSEQSKRGWRVSSKLVATQSIVSVLSHTFFSMQ